MVLLTEIRLDFWGRRDNQTIKGRQNISQSKVVSGLWLEEHTALCALEVCLVSIRMLSLITRSARIKPGLCLVPLFHWFIYSDPDSTWLWTCICNLISPLALQSVFISVLSLAFEFQQSLPFDSQECPVALVRTPHPALLMGIETQFLPSIHWASSFSSELVFSCSDRARSLIVILMVLCHQRLIIFCILSEAVTF